MAPWKKVRAVLQGHELLHIVDSGGTTICSLNNKKLTRQEKEKFSNMIIALPELMAAGKMIMDGESSGYLRLKSAMYLAEHGETNTELELEHAKKLLEKIADACSNSRKGDQARSTIVEIYRFLNKKLP